MAKKVKKLRRKELLKEDEFLTSSKEFVNVLYDNRKLIFLGVGGFLALVIIILAIGSVLRSSEAKAETQFAKALTDYKEVVIKSETAAQKPESSAEDFSEDFKKAAGKFEQVVDAYSGKRVGVLARYYAANAYYGAKDYQTSAKWYNEYLSKVGDDRKHAFVNLAYEGLGYAEEMNGKIDEALKAYEKLIEPQNKAFRERGLFNAARIYQVQKNDAKALELYKTLIEDYPDSMLASQIKKVIAQLEVGT